MALTYTSPSYAGEAAVDFISDILLDGRTIQDNLITVMPEIKKQLIIQEIETDAVLQARADNFNASGSTTIGERTLEPVNLMSQDEIGVSVLLTSWQASRQAAGANNNDITPDLGEFLINKKAQLLSISTDKRIWLGDTTLTSDNALKWHDGLLKLIENDSAVSKQAATIGEISVSAITEANPAVVTLDDASDLNVGDKITFINIGGMTEIEGLTATIQSISGNDVTTDIDTSSGFTTFSAGGSDAVQFINKSNVIEVLLQHYNQVPSAVRNAADFVIYVPEHVAEAYKDASAEAAYGSGYYFESDRPLNFKGKKIASMPYFQDNTVLSTRVGNLFFGTDLLSDMNEVEALYMKPYTMDDVYRYSAKFGSCVNYGFASQIRMYRPAAS